MAPDSRSELRVPLLIAWNVLALGSLLAFTYLAYGLREDVIVRRMPHLMIVCSVALIFLVNCGIQTLFAHPDAPALNDNLTRFIAIAFGIPLWICAYLLRAFVLLADHFLNVQLLHESSTNESFDWRIHLNWSERLCVRMHWWSFPFFFREEDIVSGRWYRGMAIPVCIFATLVFSGLVLAPLGLLWGECFTPAKGGFPACMWDGKYSNLYTMPLLLVMVGWTLFMAFILVVLTRVKDQLYLRMELTAQFLLVITMFAVGFGIQLAPIKDPSVDPGTATVLAVIACVFLIAITFPVAAWGIQRIRTLVTGGAQPMQHTTESFQRLLADKELFAQFKKVLAEHFSLENGLFWDDFREVEVLVSTKKGDDGIKAALNKLYLLYVPPGAPRELNLMSSTRESVIRDFNGGRLSLRSFEPVKKEVFDMMYSHSLPQFLQQYRARNGSLAAAPTTAHLV
ncbi:regulator of G-protein signaling [Blastocladiella emersonii ATCC 22665]|nr:regulator of G-protein signaling [Blastocladiella emersonii ATCC 22665]